MQAQFRVFEQPEIRYPMQYLSSQGVYDSHREYSKAGREMFIVLHMDAKNKQITKQELHGLGNNNGSPVYPDEIIKSALFNNSTSLIFIHNHPSGDPTPSESDRNITRRLVLCALIFGIKALDHIIIGEDRYYSFADEGLMEEYEADAGKLVETFHLVKDD